ncbi:hypothetical protein F5Y01DRAFT_327804 [Xylaria sp. FL0043]|nr:hypothetical protein F5Y01DRAFT_327804 [Xylaria sp. FL0043]
MDGHSDNTGRIPHLPYELQLGIFCSMTDMDSVRSLAVAYRYCRDVFEQNEKRITDAVYINKACEVIQELTGSRPVSFRLVKWCILLVCYANSTIRRKSPWIVNYFSNEKLPSGVDESALESKFKGLQVLVPAVWEVLEAHISCVSTPSTFKKQDRNNTELEIKQLKLLKKWFLRRRHEHPKHRRYHFPSLGTMKEIMRIYTEALNKKARMMPRFLDLKRSMANREHEMETLKSAVDSYKSAVDIWVNAIDNYKSGVKRFKRAVKDVKRAIDGLKRAIDNIEETLTQLTTTLQEIQ